MLMCCGGSSVNKTGNMKNKLVSNCCLKPVKVSGVVDFSNDDVITRCYMCTECGNPCDAIIQEFNADKNGQYTMFEAKEDNIHVFDYECPECRGKFNHPYVREETSNIRGFKCCPFCGRGMI